MEFRSPADVLRSRGKLGPYATVVEPDVFAGIDPAAVRAWATEQGIDVAAKGRIPVAVVDRYRAAQAG